MEFEHFLGNLPLSQRFRAFIEVIFVMSLGIFSEFEMRITGHSKGNLGEAQPS